MARNSLKLTGSPLHFRAFFKVLPHVISGHPFCLECATQPVSNCRGARVKFNLIYEVSQLPTRICQTDCWIGLSKSRKRDVLTKRTTGTAPEHCPPTVLSSSKNARNPKLLLQKWEWGHNVTILDFREDGKLKDRVRDIFWRYIRSLWLLPESFIKGMLERQMKRFRRNKVLNWVQRLRLLIVPT